MPEISSKYIPAHMFDKDPNPKLLKFVRRVTDRLPGKVKGKIGRASCRERV